MVAALELRCESALCLHDSRHFHLEDRGDVSGGAAAGDHVLGNLVPHGGHGHCLGRPFERQGSGPAPSGLGRGGSNGRRRARSATLPGQVRLDVFPADPAAFSRPSDQRKVDAVLAGQPSHQRRGAHLAGFFRSPRERGSRPAGGLHAGGGFGCIRGAVDEGHDGIDIYGLVFLHQNLRQDAGSGGGNFGIHLVGGNLKERLVALHRVADLLKPADDGAFGDAFPHLGHDDLGCH